MAENSLISGLGIVFFEIGIILFLSLTSSYFFNKLGIPAVLGLLIGGMVIGLLSNARGYIFSADFDSFRIVLTEIALGFIAYDIGNEIDLRVWTWPKVKKYGLVLFSGIFTFLIVSIGIYLIFNVEFWFAMIFGAIAMTTAPAVTSDILGDYHATGSLSQAIIFILALDAVISILLINISFSILTSSNVGINLILDIILFVGQKIVYSIIFSVIASLIFLVLLERGLLEEKSIVEWILGLSLIIIGLSIVFNGSVLLSMLLFGIMLKTMESRHEILTVHVLQIEILLIPVVLMFYVLMGLIIDFEILLGVGLFMVLTYFFLRFISKSYPITYFACKYSSFEPDVSKNLHLCLITQAGIALSLTGLAYNHLITLNLVEEAKILVSVIGISIIMTQLIGPILLRIGIRRCKTDSTKFTLLSAIEDPLVEM